jgi:hypothetical protein
MCTEHAHAVLALASEVALAMIHLKKWLVLPHQTAGQACSIDMRSSTGPSVHIQVICHNELPGQP